MNSIRSTLIRALVVAAMAMSSTPLLAAPGNDGFGAFWTKFSAAVVQKDQAAVSKLVRYPIYYDDGEQQAADFPKIWKGVFDAKQRACLAKQKPLRDVSPDGEVTYSAFCGELIYVFSSDSAGWKLTDFGVDD